MLRPAFVQLPVHPQRAVVELLQPVQPHVALARQWVVRQYQRKGDVRPTVKRPAGWNRQVRQRWVLGVEFLVHRRAADLARADSPDLDDLVQHLQLAQETLRRRPHRH